MAAYVYNLTSLTGRNRNADRRVIINGFDVRRRSLIVTGAAVGAGLLPSILAGLIFGPLGFIITPAVFIAAAFFLFETRSRKGLQQRMYRSILDKRRANLGVIYICWRPVSETLGRAVIQSSSAPRPAEVEPNTTPAVFTPAVSRTELRGNTVASLLEA